jgi:transaldolase/glucose-6-phosphate isomerase
MTQSLSRYWSTTIDIERLWNRDKTLWTGADEDKWLGWLDIADRQLAQRQRFTDLAASVKSKGYKDAVLLGMGGSSLCPEVLSLTFGQQEGFPELHILDSTDPAQVKAIETIADPKTSLYIVSSKSGSTLEPNIFKDYFFDKSGRDGARFIAITDPGSKMQAVAEQDRFSLICYGDASIGGRYSALSDFGMVPAAVMGIDAPKFLDRADVMAIACSSCLPVEKNPGVLLGLILGIAAKNKRDKVTLIASPGISDFGAWLEQLLAESTGKDGKGLIPVDREALGAPEVYGNDRVFAYIRLENGADVAQDKAVDAIAKAGHPVIRIALADTYNLGQEMFRWEIATAVAGSVIGINPFNQPDVEASKIATRKLTAEYEKTGSLPPESPIWSEDGIQLFTDEKNAAALASAVGSDKSLVGYLRAHLKRLGTGDYFALLAYVQMNEPRESTLQGMRIAIRDKRRAATCLGFGPRFLHSTGQAYKGGPNSGVFLQVTCDDKNDLPVPGQKFTFGVVKAAQARGDFQVLAERNRRALRVHLKDVDKGLTALESAIKLALS